MGNPVRQPLVEERDRLRSWDDPETRDCRLRVVNNSDLVVDVLWVLPSSDEASYRTLQPGQLHLQATFTTHVWRLRAVLTRRLLAEHVGGDTTLELLPDGTVRAHAGDSTLELLADGAVAVPAGFRPDIVPVSATPPPAEWGAYRERATTAVGITITAWDCVCDAAVVGAADILERMLEAVPVDVRQRLVAADCDVAIIGRKQVTSDIPAHNFLKGDDAGDGTRTFDDGCRGVGGSPLIPTTSCGEENVTMVDDPWYPSEQILIHEFGHTVMDLGLAKPQRDAVLAAYRAAMKRELYDADCYMASNPQEYWAEGTQAWFDASVRSDVNSGINTRAGLKAHDLELAALMAHAYGDGEWRYPQTAPAAFTPHAGARSPRKAHSRRGLARRFLQGLPGAACCLSCGIAPPASGSGSSVVRLLFGRCLPSQRQYSKVV